MASWEERYLKAFEDDDLYPIRDIGKTAAKRARELDEDDLADDLEEQTADLQRQMDELQDLFSQLDEAEKSG